MVGYITLSVTRFVDFARSLVFHVVFGIRDDERLTKTTHPVHWTQNICEPGRRHNKKGRWKGQGEGEQDPYALSLPLPPLPRLADRQRVYL
jgi:hypothetical protein